jgi:hypothetical protein
MAVVYEAEHNCHTNLVVKTDSHPEKRVGVLAEE